jgi:hypothetical protein
MYYTSSFVGLAFVNETKDYNVAGSEGKRYTVVPPSTYTNNGYREYGRPFAVPFGLSIEETTVFIYYFSRWSAATVKT